MTNDDKTRHRGDVKMGWVAYLSQLLENRFFDSALFKVDPRAVNDFLDDRLVDVADGLVRHLGGPT